ncbi:hypothetical protein NQ317_018017 [Molorchus minor]|uniref:Uncharacterized protein n=1 Tax=Molorchus minor TaxID=1323400 RepID=A0ABQ9JSI3_9CUCU|nr:hypothetical protein NQ317_018017 [Molorchus minor]
MYMTQLYIQVKGYLKPCELEHSMKVLIKLAQMDSFSQEINALEKQKPVDMKSIAALNPFMDNNGVLRVGGKITIVRFGLCKKSIRFCYRQNTDLLYYYLNQNISDYCTRELKLC